MRAKSWILVVVLLPLAVCYAVFFTHWFDPPKIPILAQMRPNRSLMDAGSGATAFPVSFAFDRKYDITEIKVVAVADVQTNKYPRALWHLVGNPKSEPKEAILYGQPIPGMKPKWADLRAEPLLPEVKYRLHLTAGRWNGTIDFDTLEAGATSAR